MLKRFTDELAKWPAHVRAQCELVLVDDCGSPPVEPAELAGLDPMRVQLLRHTKDVPWAQPCCRNLAASEATGDVFIMVDPDMIIRAEDAHKFVKHAQQLEQGFVTRFVLKEVNCKDKDRRGTINRSSPNTWIVRKEDFESVGGYNERFAGHKGWSDVELYHTLDCAFKVRQTAKLTVDFYRRCKEIPDADVQGLEREVKTNCRTHAQNRETVRKRYGGNWYRWAIANPPGRLNLPFERKI